MAVIRCPLCHGVSIEWLMTRYGRRLPFERPIPVAEAADREGWIPGMWTVRKQDRMALAPLSHYAVATRERVRHVVLVHACPEYQAHIAAVTGGT